MPPPYTEADAQAYAARVGVRVETARTTLGVRPQAFSADLPLWPHQGDAVRAYAAEHGLTVHQALKALHADSNRTSAAAAASAVATFNRANGIKPTTATPNRTRSAEVAAEAAPRPHPPAHTAPTPVPSDPKAAEARAIACRAAATSAVALFMKTEGAKHHD